MESLAEGSLPLTDLHAKEEEHKEVKSGCLKRKKKNKNPSPLVLLRETWPARGAGAATRGDQRRPPAATSLGGQGKAIALPARPARSWPGQGHRGGGWHRGCEPPSLAPTRAASPRGDRPEDAAGDGSSPRTTGCNYVHKTPRSRSTAAGSSGHPGEETSLTFICCLPGNEKEETEGESEETLPARAHARRSRRSVFHPNPSQLGRALPHHHILILRVPRGRSGLAGVPGAGRKGYEVWGGGGAHWDWGTQIQSSRYPMVGAAWLKKNPSRSAPLSHSSLSCPCTPRTAVETLVQTHTSLKGRRNRRQESAGISLPRS